MSTRQFREHADGAAPTESEIREALALIDDPELGTDIVSLGMVGSIAVSGTVATVGIKLTTKACPLRNEIETDIVSMLGRHPGLTAATVGFSEMTADERTQLMSRARQAAQETAPKPELGADCRVLLVGSGKGGVGKSSVTVNLATALARSGYTVGLLDADISGFSIPRLIGIDARLEARPGEGGRPMISPHAKPVGDGLLKVVSTGFLVDETTALMWRGLMLNKAVEQFLLDVDWGDLDFLVLDLPPGTGDVQMGVARMLPDAQLVVVTTPAVAAQRVAQRAADMARRSFLEIYGVIENMSAFTCDHGTEYALFGSGGGAVLAEAIGVPLLAQIPIAPSISVGNDTGTPVASGDGPIGGIFADLAERIVREIPAPSTDPASMPIGCTAQMLEAVERAFADRGSATSVSGAKGWERQTPADAAGSL